MALKKNDFIEIEFTGRIKEGEIFDSNIKKDLEEAKISTKAKPFIFSIGNDMFLKGVEDFLIEKEIGKQYNLELHPENAFGKRDPSLIQRIPSKIFYEHKINPIRGETFNFDGRIGRILSVSGGRVIVDFNNPLSGKIVVYKLKILRKVEDLKEKIKSFNEFLFHKEFKFEVKEKKLIIEVDKKMIDFVKMFKEKFKEIFDLDLEIKEVKEEKPKENKIQKEEIKTD